jgi:hypothetical protein
MQGSQGWRVDMLAVLRSELTSTQEAFVISWKQVD